jgi:hypothetical protein
LQGELQNEASYEADIPICAILSTFRKLAWDYEKGNESSLDKIYNELDDTQSPASKTWTLFWKQMTPFHQEPTVTFGFKCLGSTTTSSQASSGEPAYQSELEALEEQEDELKEKLKEPAELTIESDKESGQPILVFITTFPLLMGRAHALPESKRPPWLEQQMTKFAGLFAKKNNSEILPCNPNVEP